VIEIIPVQRLVIVQGWKLSIIDHKNFTIYFFESQVNTSGKYRRFLFDNKKAPSMMGLHKYSILAAHISGAGHRVQITIWE
jgi:hypothetical protein